MRGHGGPRRKVWTRTKILSPNIQYFCRKLIFVTIYALLGDLWAKKRAFFGQKQCFLGQEVHYYMVYIAYFNELNLQICDYAQKWRICRKNCKYALDENFHGDFCPRQKAANFCHIVGLKSPTKHWPKSLDQTSALNTWPKFNSIQNFWSIFSLRILTKLQLQNLDQTSASKLWPNLSLVLTKNILQNLDQTSASISWPNLSFKISTKLLSTISLASASATLTTSRSFEF